MPGRSQVCEHGERFDGFAQAHLVTDEDLLLSKREACAEALVGAQGSREKVSLEFPRANRLDDVFGQIAVHVLLILGVETEFGEHAEVISRT